MHKIYYFSSTGNSLYVAKSLGSELQASIIPISKVINQKDIEIKSESIGIVFPVYMWGPPAIICDFLKKIKIIECEYLYAIITFGGLGGRTLKYTDNILSKNGYKLDAGFNVQLIDNYLPFFKIPDDNKKQDIFLKAEESINDIVRKVKLKEKVSYKTHRGIVGYLFSSFFYKICIGRVRFMSKHYYSDNNCNSCGTCVKLCPVSNIKLVDGKPKWGSKCEHCLRCLHWCHKSSIQYKKSTIGKQRYHHPKIKLTEFL